MEVTLGGYVGLSVMTISVVQMFDCSGIFFNSLFSKCICFNNLSSCIFISVSTVSKLFNFFFLQYFLFKGFIRLIIIQDRCIIQ